MRMASMMFSTVAGAIGKVLGIGAIYKGFS
jgi:hypothetical protein